MKDLPIKIEMHTHTSESSPCAHVSAANMVSMYQAAGYDAVVITDHYCKWVMEQSGASTPEEYVEYFLSGYHAALTAAKNLSFTVLFGAEINLLESPNDYLLYGASEDFFRKHLSLYELSLAELSSLCHKNNILLFQAHPYRTYCTPSDAALLDGTEYYNGNPRHNNQNEKATEWAKANKLLASSGSDFHEKEDLAKGGILTTERIQTTEQLRDLLKSGNYTLIQP